MLKAEYLKNRRRYIFLTALALTAAAGAWAFYGSYTGESRDGTMPVQDADDL